MLLKSNSTRSDRTREEVPSGQAQESVLAGKKILHIDMDAFFASVEQRDFPEFRNKPLVVGGDPKKRGVVAAASYEARTYGIHSAMPSAEAARRCSNLIFLTPRFEVYRSVSLQIREIFHDYTDLVEPLSLDEAYLDVTDNRKGERSATRIALEIRRRILRETGLTASAGVAHNKFLAKIASDINKPNGLFVIPPEKAEAFLEDLEIGRFHGIGEVTERKMKSLGIERGRDLKQWSRLHLVRHFGKAGNHYYRIVRGVDLREVQPHRIRKSIGKERTFTEDVSDRQWIHSFLRDLSEKVSSSLQRHKASGKTLTLKIRFSNFETITRSLTVSHWISGPGEIGDIAIRLFEEAGCGDRKIRLLGITLSALDTTLKGEGKQLALDFTFGQDSSNRSDS